MSAATKTFVRRPQGITENWLYAGGGGFLEQLGRAGGSRADNIGLWESGNMTINLRGYTGEFLLLMRQYVEECFFVVLDTVVEY